MNKRSFFVVRLIEIVLAAVAVPLLSAQQASPRYKLTDLGTFGGPEGTLSFAVRILNDHGMFAGQMDTTLTDTYYPNFNPFIYPFPKPLVQHASLFRDGVLIDLSGSGSLQNGGAVWVNSAGHTVGGEENGLIDPSMGYPEVEGRLWRNGEIVPLGNLAFLLAL
jgi:hypothetical protein